jgi:S1-C subfamily serine protease
MNSSCYIPRSGASRLQRAAGIAFLFCLLLLCPFVARGRQTAAPPAPQSPATTPAAKSPQPSVHRITDIDGGARRPRPLQAVAPVAAPVAPGSPAQTKPATPARKGISQAPLPPRQVVTVLHRLSGWKLLAWLASSGPPAFELDELPSMADSHTNIVAGYIYEDGHSVVARLPRAEVELDSFPAPPAQPALFASTGVEQNAEPEYMIVTADGKRVEAKFVGLDSSTGLTLLEAVEPLLPGVPEGDQGDTEDPTVGQRVRLYAPAPANNPAPQVAGTAPQANAGFIYMSIDQKEGRLTEVRRAPSGKPFRVVARASVSPEWTGAVAANESGEVVGIVSQSQEGETQIVPMATVLSACDRVLKLRGNAPQPWLGVRGDAAFQAPLAAWVNLGWKPELALPHIEKHQGVFLTAVAPETPAALAGLRPGDLISGVGPREVRSLDDLSQTLKEAGVGSTVDLTIWRALEPGPLKLSVELQGTKNPALATAEAEERAVRASLLATQQEIRELRATRQRLGSNAGRANDPEMSRLSARMNATQERLAKLLKQLESAEAKMSAARAYTDDASWPQPPAQPDIYATTSHLQKFGLSAIGLTPHSAARLGAQGGLLVVSVRPESTAATGGVRAGDVIETVNGSPFMRLELRRLLTAPDPPPLSFGVVREGHRLTVNFSLPGSNEQQR